MVNEVYKKMFIHFLKIHDVREEYKKFIITSKGDNVYNFFEKTPSRRWLSNAFGWEKTGDVDKYSTLNIFWQIVWCEIPLIEFQKSDYIKANVLLPTIKFGNEIKLKKEYNERTTKI